MNFWSTSLKDRHSSSIVSCGRFSAAWMVYNKFNSWTTNQYSILNALSKKYYIDIRGRGKINIMRSFTGPSLSLYCSNIDKKNNIKSKWLSYIFRLVILCPNLNKYKLSDLYGNGEENKNTRQTLKCLLWLTSTRSNQMWLQHPVLTHSATKAYWFV